MFGVVRQAPPIRPNGGRDNPFLYYGPRDSGSPCRPVCWREVLVRRDRGLVRWNGERGSTLPTANPGTPADVRESLWRLAECGR